MRSLITLLGFLSLSFQLSSGASNRLVLEPANQGVALIQKHRADLFGAELGLRIAGIELEDVELNGRSFQQVIPICEDSWRSGETGEVGLPQLPVFAHLIAIPDQSGVRLEIVSSSYQIVEDVDVMPAQPFMVEGSQESPPFAMDESFYQRQEFYPPTLIELGEPVICRDLRAVQVIINPVQYNPATRQLRVYTSIDYNLTFEGYDGRNVKVRHSNRIAASFLPLYRALAPNADELLSVYEPIRGGYLILTPDAFADTIAVLGRWKHLKGYDVVIATASDIDPNGSSPTQSEVFNYIQNAYNTWTVPPEFVLIVGDENLSIPDYPYGSYASDHEYSCVDGDDYFSDVLVTRMSISGLSNLRVAMRKALVYDASPYMGDPDYWLRGLSVAGNVYAITPRLTTLWVRQRLLEHGYTRVDTVFAWYSGAPGADSINASLNRGVSVISYRGWAGANGWYSPVYDKSNINGLTHGWKMGVMASLVCGTGNFGYSECFGETWIRAGSVTFPKGGPAFYGVSDGNTHTKWNNAIMFGYYWGILEEGIYNFAAAAFRGKMQLYNMYPRFNGPGSNVEKYFYTYNTLGEPELEVRTATPKGMTVSYPSSIPVGTNILSVHVDGEGGFPLEKAYVNLVKGYQPNEEVFVGGWTDAAGNITLDFATATPDTMYVTVTARGYIPHRGHTIVENQPVAVGVNTIAFDDDNSGNSSGNSDGNVNPSETVEFDVSLKNFGYSTTATNVSATLTSSDPDVTITVPTQSYGDIPPGGTAGSGKFAASFANDMAQGEHVILTLDIDCDQGSWTGALPIDIKSMAFVLINVSYPGDSNGRLDPGETSDVVITLENHGELDGLSLTGNLSTADTGITVIDGSADFGDIAIGASGSNQSSPFVVQVGGQVYDGYNVNFDLQLTSSNGSVAHRTVPIVIGNISSFDPIGPDGYGYYVYDNTDVGYLEAPVYDWFEISPYAGGPGTRVNFPFETDDDAAVISLPFNFVYYGQSFNYLLVSTNGFVAFDTSAYDMSGRRWAPFHNKQIPEVGAPRGLIAPFWDDLVYSGNNGVFQYYDPLNHRFIIEWKNCQHPNPSPPHSPETFQMIIYDPEYYPTPTGDSEILFQYETVYNDDNDYWDFDRPGLYCTVGMQNLDNDDGLQYTYDNLYHPGAAVLAAGRAIKITTATGTAPPPDIDYAPSSFTKAAQPGQIVTDTLNISNVGEGSLAFSIIEMPGDRRLVDNGTTPESPMKRSLPATPVKFEIRQDSKPLDQKQPIYPPSTLNEGGPDNFGHRWIDSDEPGGPIYNWIDISGTGVEVTLGDDDYVGPISMGITFPFYENSYSSVYIGSNGFISFGSGSNTYSNQGIPDPSAPNNFIAMLWDDLNPSAGGSVYYYHDVTGGRFIVSYNNVPFWYSGEGGTGSLSFEVILYPSGRIVMQYASLNPGQRDLLSNTVGIENINGSDGLQIAYNNSYLHDNLAITIYYPPPWLQSDIHGGLLGPGADTTAIITFDATELPEGTYTASLEIECNDPDEPSISIPVTFVVGGACDYVPGDVNSNGQVNVVDVTYLVNFLSGFGPTPPDACDCPPFPLYAAADANGNCSVNVVDVTYLVNFLSGIGSPPSFCPDCPPAGDLRRKDGSENIPNLRSRSTGRSGLSQTR